MHMIQSQVVPGFSSSGYSQTKSGFGPSFSNVNGSVGGRFGSTELARSKVNDPMKESTMSYMRSIYRGTPNISEERLRQISDNFLRLYGTDR